MKNILLIIGTISWAGDTARWELLMTNVYQLKEKDMHSFAFIRPDYNGLATNG